MDVGEDPAYFIQNEDLRNLNWNDEEY